jgi:polyribonucleotide nucleotidyltransferase
MARTKGSKNKPKTVTPNINWEKLAKDLQQALAKEIKENDELEKDFEFVEGAMHIAAAKAAIAKKQIEFLQDMLAKVMVNAHGHDSV